MSQLVINQEQHDILLKIISEWQHVFVLNPTLKGQLNSAGTLSQKLKIVIENHLYDKKQ